MTTDDLRKIDKDMLDNSFAIRELAEGMWKHSMAIIVLSAALLFLFVSRTFFFQVARRSIK